MPILRIEKNLAINYLDPVPENPNPVLLLHGLGSDSSSWSYQIPVLGDAGYRPIAPDTRGFGSSTYPPEGHTIPVLAEDLVSRSHSPRISWRHILYHPAGAKTGEEKNRTEQKDF